MPRAGLAVGTDGRWRDEKLAGRAAPTHPDAEWIGESARAAQRRSAIERLTAEREVSWRVAQAATLDHEAQVAALAELDRSFTNCPGDDDLRTALIRAADRDQTAQRSAADAERLKEQAGELRASADTVWAALLEFCTAHGFPHDEPGLEAAVDDLAETERKLDGLRNATTTFHKLNQSSVAVQERQSRAVATREELERGLEALGRQVAESKATVATLEATVNASDREVLAELERLRDDVRSSTQAQEELGDRLREIASKLAGARVSLAGEEEKRQLTTELRDAAFARFRIAVDRGLPEEAGLELPDVLSTSIDRVREQVASARRQLETVMARWPDDPEAQAAEVQGRAGRLTLAAHEVRQELETSGRSLRVVFDDRGLPRVEVQVDATGVGLPPREASARLAQIHAELDAAYSRRVQETLDELLGSTFLEHLRTRLGATDGLVRRINDVLAAHRVVTTSTSLRIVLEPASEQDRIMLEAVRGSSLANPEVAAHVREHLRARVEEAKRLAVSAGEPDWRDRLAETLDYRHWFSVHLQKQIGHQGRWSPLTTQSFAEMSGGARAVSLMLPLVATLAALYEDMDGAPRPLWLDEAFDGLDSANRSMIMDLFRSFDLDVLLAGPARLVNVRTVPAAAIYQVVRAPAPLPGADLTLELWAGGDLLVVDLPATLPTTAAPDDQKGQRRE